MDNINSILYRWHLHHPAHPPEKRKTFVRQEAPFPSCAAAAADGTACSVHINTMKYIIITFCRHICGSQAFQLQASWPQTLFQTWPATNFRCLLKTWLGSRVVSVLDSGAEGPGFKSQSQRCRVTVLGKLFTPIRASVPHQSVPLFTEQQNW